MQKQLARHWQNNFLNYGLIQTPQHQSADNRRVARLWSNQMDGRALFLHQFRA